MDIIKNIITPVEEIINDEGKDENF